MTSALFDLARSETSSMYGNSMHENRETPSSPTSGRGRPRWEGEEPKPTMNGGGESDNSIVPVKRSNEGERSLEEGVEGRGLTKRNTRQRNTVRTQCRNAVSSELARIRCLAKQARVLHPWPEERLQRYILKVRA